MRGNWNLPKAVLLSAVMLDVLMPSLSGCASRRPPIEDTAEQAADAQPRGETFGQKMRDKGTDTLPFWYSDKSKDIARNLGSGD